MDFEKSYIENIQLVSTKRPNIFGRLHMRRKVCFKTCIVCTVP